MEGAQQRLGDALAAIRATGDPDALRQVKAQRGELIALRATIATAGPAALVALRAEVMAAVATASTGTTHGGASARPGDATVALAEARAASRTQVAAVMGGMHDFNDQLRFAGNDDQRAYRARAATRDAYAKAQQALHTPHGDLNAAGAAVGQMADAHAHGAHGPAFNKRWGELVATTEKLREAAKANGISTEEFDRRLREDLRRIMKAKGLSDTEIDARFAATPDPLEAAKAFVKGDDMQQVGVAAQKAAKQPAASLAACTTAPTADDGMSGAIANLQAAGVTADAAPLSEHAFAHGVTVQARAVASGRTVSS